MGNFSSIDISASGLFAQRVRLDTIANNIANADTTRTSKGGPYRKQEVVFKAHMDKLEGGDGGVEVAGIVERDDPPVMKFDPGNPDANADGYVAMPNVNPVEEMVDMITATRAYEANVQAINAARTMASRALEIGRG
jgi:flagellar basal-body rod protein FlgC